MQTPHTEEAIEYTLEHVRNTLNNYNHTDALQSNTVRMLLTLVDELADSQRAMLQLFHEHYKEYNYLHKS